jgi:hypothetical protein
MQACRLAGLLCWLSSFSALAKAFPGGSYKVVFPSGDTLALLRLTLPARQSQALIPPDRVAMLALLGLSLSLLFCSPRQLAHSVSLSSLPPHVEVFLSPSPVIKLPQLAPLFSVFPLSLLPPSHRSLTLIISRDESHNSSHIQNQMPPRSLLPPRS